MRRGTDIIAVDTDGTGEARMTKKLADLLFLGAILVVLTSGLVKALLFPKEINDYENRYANRMPAFTLEGYLDGSFQREVDDALSDQVTLSITYKRIYNFVRTESLWPAVAAISKSYPDRYINYRSVRVFGGDYLVYHRTRTLSDITGGLDAKIANYNEAFARLPDREFYVYLIERDTGIDFETGEKPPVYEYLRDRLELPAGRVARFAVDDFETYSGLFYRTDHHWNHRGSYRGYLEVLELLGVEDGPLVPLEEVTLPGRFSGSKASAVGVAGIGDTVTMYRFEFPALTFRRNGESAEDYGAQSRFLSGQGGDPTYGNIYGGDDGETVISGGKPGGENILLIGESFDNALLKLLACHFGSLYAVDLRNYSAWMGKDFQLSAYLEEHGIRKVLLIGSDTFFMMDEFRLEG